MNLCLYIEDKLTQDTEEPNNILELLDFQIEFLSHFTSLGVNKADREGSHLGTFPFIPLESKTWVIKLLQADIKKPAISADSGKLFCLLLLFCVLSHSHKISITYGIGLCDINCYIVKMRG